MRVWRLAFEVWRSAFGVRRGNGRGKGEWAGGRVGEWASGRMGETAIVVPTAFEDEDDDEYEDDGLARGLA